MRRIRNLLRLKHAQSLSDREISAALATAERRGLREILGDRHGRGAILLTSQLPVDARREVTGNPTLAAALLERPIHDAQPHTGRSRVCRIRPSGLALGSVIRR